MKNKLGHLLDLKPYQTRPLSVLTSWILHYPHVLILPQALLYLLSGAVASTAHHLQMKSIANNVPSPQSKWTLLGETIKSDSYVSIKYLLRYLA